MDNLPPRAVEETPESCLQVLAPYISQITETIRITPLSPDQKAKLATMVATGFCSNAVNLAIETDPTKNHGQGVDQVLKLIGSVLRNPLGNIIKSTNPSKIILDS